MELITLNAMVISIKSGEKGRAFSCITDNLKRLSNQMFVFSDNLINEEQKLVADITSLKQIFDGIVASQKLLASLAGNSASGIEDFIHTSSAPLGEMAVLTGSVYPPIQKTMEGLQMQDIIRQALDHVLLCLNACNEQDASPQPENELDSVCFNIELMKISESVLKDIISKLSDSIIKFDSNWDSLTKILGTVEQKRNSYVNKYIDTDSHSTDSMLNHIDVIIRQFTDLMQEFNHYHIVQKDLEFTCKSITQRTRTMYSVFENLKPVINNLHHVRILQQIEVSKNEAISSVRDSVTDMDNHIVSAKTSLDSMQQILMKFNAQTEQLLAQFQIQINKDNEQMKVLRTAKTDFFNDLRMGHDEISSIFHNFTVLPAGFEQECVDVQSELKKLKTIKDGFLQIADSLHNSELSLTEKRKTLLSAQNITAWDIKNDRFKELIQHFTITAHKEEAGKIGGFGVEKGIDAGEITFF